MAEFTIAPIYDSATDSLIVYLKDTPSFGRRIDAQFTVFLSAEDESFVGFEIAGFKELARVMLRDNADHDYVARCLHCMGSGKSDIEVLGSFACPWCSR